MEWKRKQFETAGEEETLSAFLMILCLCAKCRKELENLRSQIGTSSWEAQGDAPLAFTEQGVAMLSSVLNSPRVTIDVNYPHYVRIFTRLREMLFKPIKTFCLN